MIDEESVERAVHWLAANADAAAKARAEREYLSEFRKSLKARLMREHEDLPLVAQEREAYSHPEYLAHLGALKAAIYEDERLRWLKTAAETKVSAWQSQQRMLKG